MPFRDPAELAAYQRAYRESHRADARAYRDAHKPESQAYRDAHKPERKAYDAKRKDRQSPRVIVGVDGEGHDTPDGRHIYTYLAAVDENGRLVSETHNRDGLTHDECASMLLAIPRNTLIFGFMFSYDVTKIIEEMPLVDRYYLLRPDLRRRWTCKDKECAESSPRGRPHRWGLTHKKCPSCGKPNSEAREHTEPVRYKTRAYDWFNGSFTVHAEYDKQKGKYKRRTHVWDCFRFFGTSFVEALKDWQIGTPEQVARIAAMKQKRGSFEREDVASVQAYCREECHLLAVMMRKVITSHEEAGLPLTRFHGAGSTASVMLKKHEVARHKGPRLTELDEHGEPAHPALRHAIACAFFGGRFENSIIGIVEKPLSTYDIASAYPYAMTSHPCLACGSWRKTRNQREIEKAPVALCRFLVARADQRKRERIAWMPLPFRDEKGSIAYPTGCTGWAWKAEALAARAGWSNDVTIAEAWIYETECDHQPFAFLPHLYRQRIAWGKEGAGKALKLGTNAAYGKTAQSKGSDPPYQSWVWAGMTTASCRAQLLDAIKLARDPWSVLALATDGISSTEPIALPEPRETGTSDLSKPLGVWEPKTIPEGGFFAKPGLYFRLNATLLETRARGVGRREVFEQRERLLAGFRAWDRQDFNYSIPLQSRRFFGAKHSIHAHSQCAECKTGWPGHPEKRCPKCGNVGNKFNVKEMVQRSITKDGETRDRSAYGLWGVRTSEIRFDPRPKREAVMHSHSATAEPFARMCVRDMGGAESAPYRPGLVSPEAESAQGMKDFLLEQPDWDDNP